MPGPVGPGGPAHPRSGIAGGEPAVASPAAVTATADFPELLIEWLPSEGPNVTDGTWVPLTSVTYEGSITRGRNYELDRFEAGTLTLTLRTANRNYDPENTAGVYYGQLLPMRQIRMSAVWAGIRYPVFRGYIQSWGNTVPDDVLFVTTIVAKDAFARLEQIKLPSSAWALELLRDNPTCWLRLGESGTARVTDSSANGNYGIYDNCQQGAQGLVTNDSDGAVQFAHSLEERVRIQNPALITAFPFTVSLAFQIDGANPTGSKTMFAGFQDSAPASLSANGIQIYMVSSLVGTPGNLIANVNGTGTNTTGRYDDDEPHLLTVLFGGTYTQIYVDGVLDGSRTHASPTWIGTSPSGYTLGNYIDLLFGDFGFGTNDAAFVDSDGNTVFPLHARGTIDEFAVYDGQALTADRVTAQYDAFLGWAGDDTGARIERFLDAIGWPAELRDIETGASTLGAASWSAGSSALSVLQSWAETELGQFFIDRDGKIVSRSRHYPILNLMSTRSQATIGDGNGGETLRYDNQGFELVRDETLIRNPVTASRTNGVSVTVRDDDLADNTFGDRTWASPATEDQKDSAVRDRAMWLLARFKNLSSRLDSMRISPRRDPANLWPLVLGRELGDRITVRRQPLGLDATTQVDQILERVTHKFSPTVWQTTWRGSPVDPNVGSYLILDDDAYGLLDTGLLSY